MPSRLLGWQPFLPLGRRDLTWSSVHLLAILTCSFLLSYSFAQAQWQLLGLDNESVSAIAVGPSDSAVLYAGSRSDFSSGTVGGIFKSVDQGNTWDTLARGLSVSEIAVDPTNANIVYVTSASPLPAVLKTSDAGFTWSASDSGIYLDAETGAVSFAIHPTRPETLFCGTGGFFGGGLYKSTNGGEWWFPVHCDSGSQTIPCNTLRGGVASMALDISHPDTVYAGTAGVAYILKSTDGGTTWNFTGYSGYRLPYALAVSISDPQLVFAGVGSEGLHRSTDGGFSWQRILNGLPDTTGTVISISSEYSGQMYCAFAGQAQSSDVFCSWDDGENWSPTGFPLEVDLFYGDVASSPGTEMVYAGGSYGIYVMGPSSVGEGISFPNETRLSQNYPNPFNSSTVIPFTVTNATWTELTIYDLLGRHVVRLYAGVLSPGDHRISFDASPLQSGIYFCELRTTREISRRKMVLVR